MIHNRRLPVFGHFRSAISPTTLVEYFDMLLGLFSDFDQESIEKRLRSEFCHQHCHLSIGVTSITFAESIVDE